MRTARPMLLLALSLASAAAAVEPSAPSTTLDPEQATAVYLVRLSPEARARADPAGLPLVFLVTSVLSLLLTPVLNTLIRTQEQEADVFGLNAARQPDGFAEAALQLSEYRKLAPGPIEEFLFFDHPSGRTRILTAMRWKASQPPP